MDYKLLRSDARERLKGNWTIAVVAFLVYSAIVSAVEGLGLVLGDFLNTWGKHVNNMSCCYLRSASIWDE